MSGEDSHEITHLILMGSYAVQAIILLWTAASIEYRNDTRMLSRRRDLGDHFTMPDEVTFKDHHREVFGGITKSIIGQLAYFPLVYYIFPGSLKILIVDNVFNVIDLSQHGLVKYHFSKRRD